MWALRSRIQSLPYPRSCLLPLWASWAAQRCDGVLMGAKDGLKRGGCLGMAIV